MDSLNYKVIHHCDIPNDSIGLKEIKLENPITLNVGTEYYMAVYKDKIEFREVIK